LKRQAGGVVQTEDAVCDAARRKAPFLAVGKSKASELRGMCLNPVAVATEDLRDLSGPQQADLATRSPRCFSEQLDQQFGCARDGHRCASVAKSEIQTPYNLPPSDRAIRATAGANTPPNAAGRGLGQRCPKLPGESGRFRVVSVERPASVLLFPCK
jgi:hypothetical protein